MYIYLSQPHLDWKEVDKEKFWSLSEKVFKKRKEITRQDFIDISKKLKKDGREPKPVDLFVQWQKKHRSQIKYWDSDLDEELLRLSLKHGVKNLDRINFWFAKSSTIMSQKAKRRISNGSILIKFYIDGGRR